MNAEALFEPLELGPAVRLNNRIVMAPMTRRGSPGGVPGADVAAYYRRRAAGGVGLIITEGAWVPHQTAAQYLSSDQRPPSFYGEEALAGWKAVVDEVHAVGGKIAPQLWHVGQSIHPEDVALFADPAAYQDRLMGPSGLVARQGEMPVPRGRPASKSAIGEVVDAFATAARSAQELGFDAVELHGAHGYLIDQFLWAVTNLRTDEYGGDQRTRTRFACDLVREVRRSTSRDFPIILRISQWKMSDYGARLAETPEDLAEIVEPLADAGVDVFHCSQRRFWEGEFATDLNLAAWVKRITGRPSITVGSVGLKTDFLETLRQGKGSEADGGVDDLIQRLDRGDFDLVAVGRALLGDPEWPNKLRRGALDELRPYTSDALANLV